MAGAIPVPGIQRAQGRPLRRHALALLKQIADPDAAALEGYLRQRIDRMIAMGDAVVTGAADPIGQPVGGKR